MSALDLFCGVGWDEAAHELGIEPLGIDLDPDVCLTRQVRGMRTLQGDVAALDPVAVMREHFSTAGGRPRGNGHHPLKLLIGSPPCPTFSGAGRGGGRHLTDVLVRCLAETGAGSDTRAERREECYEVLEPIYWEAEQAKARKKKRTPDREKSAATARRDAAMSVLIVEPLRWALALEPDLIALEQVPDCLPLWSVMAQILGALGYSTWAGILEAERYGVPQTRERAILMASRVGRVHPPRATHQRFVSGEPARHEQTLEGEVLPWVSMAEALGWGMTERPCVTVAAGGSRQGGPSPLDGGSGSRAVIERERERELGSIVQRYQRGVGMTERHGERPARDLSEPSFTIQAGNQGSGTRLLWSEGDTHTHTHPQRPAAYRNGNQANACVRMVDEPAPTVLFGHRSNKVEWIYDRRQTGGDGTPVGPREMTEPAPTMTAQGLAKGRDVWMSKKDDRSARALSGEAGNRPRHVDSPAATIDTRTDLAQWVGERPAGKNAVRVTVEEAATLQGFPPDFPWQGSRTSKFRQIGNAVPPPLARAILAALLGDAVLEAAQLLRPVGNGGDEGGER